MAGGKRPAPFRTRKLSRLCADGTATGGSWESKTLPQSTVSWGWGTGLETGTYPTPPFLRAHASPHTQRGRPTGYPVNQHFMFHITYAAANSYYEIGIKATDNEWRQT